MLLGTNGGPLPTPSRFGISQAVVVGGRVYLVDCGYGVTVQLRRAGLLVGLRTVLLTHLHSDHVDDYFNLFLQGRSVLQKFEAPVHVYGPGSAGGAGALPAPRAGDVEVPLASPDNPTPGLVDMTNHQLRAHAYDINIRIRETGLADIAHLLVPHEIPIPSAAGAWAPDNLAPAMEPVVVSEDDHARVTATLVSHPPVFPCFAYRFDTDAGSIVISGDTAPCSNLVTLARGADILVHEVCDANFMQPAFAADARMQHFLNSHTSADDVGKVASEAEVNTLVLSHFVPADGLPDEHWATKASANFAGEVVVGKELLELRL